MSRREAEVAQYEGPSPGSACGSGPLVLRPAAVGMRLSCTGRGSRELSVMTPMPAHLSANTTGVASLFGPLTCGRFRHLMTAGAELIGT